MSGSPSSSPSPRRPKISVVIPAFNEERLLPATLEAIRQASRGFEDQGRIHVDDRPANHPHHRPQEVERDRVPKPFVIVGEVGADVALTGRTEQ